MSTERTFDGRTVRIEEDLCIGSGNCVNMAPEVFRLGPEGIVEFIEDAPSIAPDRLQEACALCPVDALIMTDADGKQLVPPA